MGLPNPGAPQTQSFPAPGLPNLGGPQPQQSPGATPSRAEWGHSTGASLPPGHYMVVSTGRGSLPAGRAAALTSQPYLPSAPAQCLAFWYQLSTRTPGEHRNAPQGPGGTSR